MRWNPGPWLGRCRAVAAWLMPFVACLALVAVMTAMFVVVFTSFDSQRSAKRSANQAKAVAELAVEQSEENRRVLERFAPCLPGDPPDSPACAVRAESDRRLAEALASIEAQHEAQNARLAALLRRPAPRVTTARPVPASAPVPPSVSPAPQAPNPTAAPPKRSAPRRNKP